MRTQVRFRSLILVGVMGASLIGCAGPRRSESFKAPESGDAAPEELAQELESSALDTVAPTDAEARPEGVKANGVQPEEILPDGTRTTPQLIKTADLTLRVKQVDQAIERVRAIARTQQGDILNLQDQRPLEQSDRHIASITLRVPQQRLEDAIEELKELGQVQNQSIQAQDVSNQIVDSSARLRNLRRSETQTLEILERSGSIKDVLVVSQELSKIREQIEKIDAQLKSLKTRVAFSTIRIRLEAETVSLPPQENLGTQLEETWDTSTHALGEFMTALMRLGIWLAVFSPVWVLLIIGGVALKRRIESNLKQRQLAAASPPPLQPPSGPSREILSGQTPRRDPEESVHDEGAENSP